MNEVTLLTPVCLYIKLGWKSGPTTHGHLGKLLSNVSTLEENETVCKNTQKELLNLKFVLWADQV